MGACQEGSPSTFGSEVEIKEKERHTHEQYKYKIDV
jgi:hypothetical protein